MTELLERPRIAVLVFPGSNDDRDAALALEALGAEPHECVYLDDLGVNLKPARAMGMHTIKVVDPGVALAELSALTGLDLA